MDDPVSTHQSNFIGTLNVCEAMRQHGVRRVVYASSAAIYGNNGEGVAIDEATAKAPLTPYASDKLAGEHYLDFYRRQHGLEPAVFRFFNIFAAPGSILAVLRGDQYLHPTCAAGLPISVFGDGEQTRDFFYVGDLVALLMQGLLSEQVVSDPLNVGWSQAVSLNQLLAEIGVLCGGLPPVTHLPARAGDIRHSRADNARLQAHYHMPEQTPLREGLRQLLGV